MRHYHCKKKVTSSGEPVGQVKTSNDNGGACAPCLGGYKIIHWSDDSAVQKLTDECTPSYTAVCLDEFLLVCSDIGGGYGNYWDAFRYESVEYCKIACGAYPGCLTNVQLSSSESQMEHENVIYAQGTDSYATELECKIACTMEYGDNCETPIDCESYGCCVEYYVSGEPRMRCNEVSRTGMGYKDVKQECCYSSAAFECINEDYREWCPGYP